MVFLNIIDFFRDIFHNPEEAFNPEAMIRYGGLAILFLVVFAQTGFFFCFFLPGDALLFTSGVFIASGRLHHRVEIVCITLVVATFLGTLCGYWFGRSTGPLLLKRSDSVFFKRNHLRVADVFFRKYGGLALTGGLFFPIIRTFAPIVAGIIKYHFAKFATFSLLGSFLWVNLLVVSGYWLGNVPFVKRNLEVIVITIILLITVPVLVKLIREVNKIK